MEEASRKKNSARIKCGRITLVPYDERMIQRYCGWFLDDHLCEMTATKHLTLEEARDAHRTWTSDSSKTMFIVLDKELLESTGDEVASMIGDANMVLSRVDELGGPVCCEVMLMVAEPSHRGRGLGSEILSTLMRYAVQKYGVTLFEARINDTNVPSLRLFTKFGFRTEENNSVFKEVILRLNVKQANVEDLVSATDLLGYAVTL